METDKYIGIILEYASGGELFEYILAHRIMSEDDARCLFAQLISSVNYMHHKKIVHRDLKLVNMQLRPWPPFPSLSCHFPHFYSLSLAPPSLTLKMSVGKLAVGR